MMSKQNVVFGVGMLFLVGCLGGSQAEEATTKTSALTTGAAEPVDYEGGCPGPNTSCTVTDVNNQNPTTMHCCPAGYAMQGYYQASSTRESLYCRQVSYPQGGSDFNSDRSDCVWRNTSRIVGGATISLACNPGEYMIGIHQGLGRIACCWDGAQSNEYPDGPGQILFHQTTNQYMVEDSGSSYCKLWATMHSCGDVQGTNAPLMTGLNRGTNVFSCAD